MIYMQTGLQYHRGVSQIALRVLTLAAALCIASGAASASSDTTANALAAAVTNTPTPVITITNTPTPTSIITLTNTPTPTIRDTSSSSSSRRVREASLSETSLKLKTGDRETLYLDVYPSNADYYVDWSVDDNDIVSLSGRSDEQVAIRARNTGITTVTAEVCNNNGDIAQTCTCTVRVNTDEYDFDLSGSTTPNQNFNIDSLTTTLEDEFYRQFNASIRSGAEVKLSSFSGSSYGSLRVSTGSGAQERTNYTWSQFRNMYFVPTNNLGVWSAQYELTSGNHFMTGKLEIRVQNHNGDTGTNSNLNPNLNPTVTPFLASGGATATITLNNAAAYSFGGADNTNNTPGASILNNAISAAFGSSGWSYIRFNFGSLSSDSSQTGVLYLDNNRTVLTSSENIAYGDLANLYFVPAQAGTYEVGFYVYNGADAITSSGVLRIVIPDTLHTIKFSAAYTFQLSDFQYLTNGILSYIIFTPPSGGRLYANYANGFGTPLPNDAHCYFYNPALGAYPVSSVTYIPPSLSSDTAHAAASEGAELQRSEILSFRLYPQTGASIPGSFRMETGSIQASDLYIDIPAGTYYDKAVLWAVENGITNGTTPTTFEPYSTCTRGQVATFLWRASGSPEPYTKENPFVDVNPNSAFYKAILWAYENGITTGTGDNTFNPNGTCTRAHVITFLWRMAHEPEVMYESELATRYASTYYAKAISWADSYYILQDTATAFSPNALCPRADIITYLYRNLAVTL